MLFNSFEFLIFLPIVFLVYWLIGTSNRVGQNVILLIASYTFYGFWDWRFLSLIIFSSLIDYVTGIKIFSSTNKIHRRIWLYFSLFWNLGILFLFKYFNFFSTNFYKLLGVENESIIIDVILPVGLSFYTFQTLSYTIDVYKERIKPTKNLLEFLCFVSFFPQLVAGPIERASALLPQFLNKRRFNYQNAKEGLRQILWGLFKKMVVADNLAIGVNQMYADYNQFQSLELLYFVILYFFQLYCDFSGYVDIALGTARLFGFELSNNFRTPYLARTMRDFWRRWHITLGQWFRDYFYIPILKKRKRSEINNFIGLFLTFTIIGFWHGANWNFLIFGIIHAFFVISYRIIGEPSRENYKFVWQFRLVDLTFLLANFFLASVAFVFFRSPNITVAINILAKMFSFVPDSDFQSIIGLKIVFLIIFLVIEILNRKKSFPLFQMEKSIPTIFRWAFYYSLIFLIIRFSGPKVEYIYFQF